MIAQNQNGSTVLSLSCMSAAPGLSQLRKANAFGPVYKSLHSERFGKKVAIAGESIIFNTMQGISDLSVDAILKWDSNNS